MSDYKLEDTIFLLFTTRQFSDGVPTVLAGTPAIDIYEDATATPIITGETLVVDLNSVVGLNVITITATAGTGFNAGGFYSAVIQAGTVGGVSVVGEVVATFSLDASAAAVDLANATDGLGALKTLLDAIPTTAMRGTDSVDTATMRGTDNAALASVCTESRLAELDAANLPTVTDGIQTDLSNATDGLGALKALIDTVNTDLSNGTDGLGALKTLIDTVNTDLSNGTDGLGALKTLLDAIPTTAMRGTDSAALASEVTSERMATLTDWIDGGRLDLLLDAIKTATDKLTFTVANELDINIQSVNDGPVGGTGEEGNEWGPA